MAEAEKKAPAETATTAEPDFTWRWHLKVLAIIYASLGVLYVIMLHFLAEPDFKWSSQLLNIAAIFGLAAVLWGIRAYLLAREKQTPTT